MLSSVGHVLLNQEVVKYASNLLSVIGTIKKVVDIAFLILTSKWRKMRFEKYACEIRKAQVMA